MAYTGKKPIDHTDVTQSQSMTVTDDLTVDTDTLYVDSTNNRVGIGTSSPARELSIGDGTGSPNIQLLAANTGNSRLEFGDTDDSDVGEIQYLHGDNAMLFHVNASERMRIDTNGYVTMPNQPVISIGISQAAITDGSGVNLFGVTGRTYIVDVAQGITHNTSNGRFTVPVDGMYLISFYSMKNGSGTAYLNLKVNGSDWLRPYSGNNASSYSAYSVQGVRDLSANDYITVVGSNSSASEIAYGLQHLRLVIQKIS